MLGRMIEVRHNDGLLPVSALSILRQIAKNLMIQNSDV
jgi:hypothetical protein